MSLASTVKAMQETGHTFLLPLTNMLGAEGQCEDEQASELREHRDGSCMGQPQESLVAQESVGEASTHQPSPGLCSDYNTRMGPLSPGLTRAHTEMTLMLSLS